MMPSRSLLIPPSLPCRPVAAALLALVLRPGAGVGAVERPGPPMPAVLRPAELTHERAPARLVGAGPHRLVGAKIVDELQHRGAVQGRVDLVRVIGGHWLTVDLDVHVDAHVEVAQCGIRESDELAPRPLI